MRLVCLDLEGVLVPEIWFGLAENTGIESLKRTTRDETNYSLLMRGRLEILKQHNLNIQDIQKVISIMRPIVGARDFLDRLRKEVQVVILSDTFNQFAGQFMEQLGWPTLFCNDLIIDNSGEIKDFTLRQEDGKCLAVQAFQSMNLRTLACGDSYNDLSMIHQADVGCFFRPPEQICREYPDISVFYQYNELLAFILSLL